jgi:hypothetical protein
LGIVAAAAAAAAATEGLWWDYLYKSYYTGFDGRERQQQISNSAVESSKVK